MINRPVKKYRSSTMAPRARKSSDRSPASLADGLCRDVKVTSPRVFPALLQPSVLPSTIGPGYACLMPCSCLYSLLPAAAALIKNTCSKPYRHNELIPKIQFLSEFLQPSGPEEPGSLKATDVSGARSTARRTVEYHTYARTPPKRANS